MDDQDWIPLLGISRGAVSEDRQTLGLELEDTLGGQHRFSLDFEAYSRFIIGLMAVAQTAKRAREAEGLTLPEPAEEEIAVLPFPVASYQLGPSPDGSQAVLRLTTDNELIWDFILPMTAIERLRNDLDTLIGLSSAMDR